MKKLFFTLLVFMTVLSAQAKIIDFGVIAGMNIVKTEADGWKADSKGGWFVGAQMKYSFPILGLGVDASLIYSQEKVAMVEGLGDDTENLDYLAIPLHLRYDLSLPGVNMLVVPYVFTGPQAGLAMTKIEKSAMSESLKTENLVWRYDLGFGATFFKHLQAAYSYSFPLSKTYNYKVSGISEDFKSGVHRISLTYFF